MNAPVLRFAYFCPMASNRFDSPNLHFIQVGYKDGNVWMKSHRFPNDRITTPWDSVYNSSLDMAWAYLQRLGFKLVAAGEWTDSYVIASSTFETLKDMKKRATGGRRGPVRG